MCYYVGIMVLKQFSLALISSVSVATLLSFPAFAAIQEGVDAAHGNQQPIILFGNGGIFSDITNLLLFIIGAIAVIMIVIGGLRYVISGGDAKQVQAAKNTILYALVGVVVAILAYAIVNFVTGTFVNGGTQGVSGSSANSTTSSGSSVR